MRIRYLREEKNHDERPLNWYSWDIVYVVDYKYDRLSKTHKRPSKKVIVHARKERAWDRYMEEYKGYMKLSICKKAGNLENFDTINSLKRKIKERDKL